MSTLPSVQDHLAAVVALLEGDGLLVTVEDDWPDGAGWQGSKGQTDFVGFVRVTDMAGPAPRGMVDGIRSDMSFLIHAQSIGANRNHANHLRDRVHRLFVSGEITVPGRRLAQKPTVDMSGETNKDTDVTPNVFVGWDRYRVWTVPETPAAS